MFDCRKKDEETEAQGTQCQMLPCIESTILIRENIGRERERVIFVDSAGIKKKKRKIIRNLESQWASLRRSRVKWLLAKDNAGEQFESKGCIV